MSAGGGEGGEGRVHLFLTIFERPDGRRLHGRSDRHKALSARLVPAAVKTFCYYIVNDSSGQTRRRSEVRTLTCEKAAVTHVGAGDAA